MLGFITWTVDPVLLNIGPLSVRWYGALWALGLLLGYYVESKIYDHEKLPEGTMDKLFLVMVLSTIIGARVGHCFCYETQYFLEHPLEVLYVWRGGLSSHGGAFGILLSLFFFARFVVKKSYIWVLDRIVIAVAICGASIRCGNLFNHEIYGDPTNVPWAFSFMLHPLTQHTTGFSEPSHPTQIYEMIYCLVTFAVIFFLYWKTKAAKFSGLIFSVFLLGVFLSRYFLEFIKRPQEDFESSMLLNVGQLLSLPFVIAGVGIMAYWIYQHFHEKNASVATSCAPAALFVVVLAILMLIPAFNRQAELKAEATIEKTEVAVNPTVGLNDEQVLSLLAGKQFRSDAGNIWMINQRNCMVVNGKRISEPITKVFESSTPGCYYLNADGLYPKSVHRYTVTIIPDGKSVLLNLKDPRGNYAELSSPFLVK
ncbi:MAG: prolipoprotein diacylglyceryl transferase [Paludibacteraceae bacterium]|nr:prolipoprotein diacylglyceryl transferase [Paludibacteraceae bacterium]